MHIENFYSYYSMDDTRNLPTVNPIGGSPSVQLADVKNPTLAFGRDEAICRISQPLM